MEWFDGTQLRAWRERQGLSQEALAALLGVARSTIARWETGVVDMVVPRIVALALEALAQRRGDRLRHRLLAELRLSEPEALALCDALNGVWLDRLTIAVLPAELREALVTHGLARKWTINAEPLLRRLEALGPVVWTALALAVHDWWSCPTAEQLRAVGLVQTPAPAP